MNKNTVLVLGTTVLGAVIVVSAVCLHKKNFNLENSYKDLEDDLEDEISNDDLENLIDDLLLEKDWDLDDLYREDDLEYNKKMSFEYFFDIVGKFMDLYADFDEMYDFLIDNNLFDNDGLIDKKKLKEDDIWEVFKIRFLRKTYHVYDFEDLEIDFT